MIGMWPLRAAYRCLAIAILESSGRVGRTAAEGSASLAESKAGEMWRALLPLP